MECILLLPNKIKNSVIEKVRNEYPKANIKFMSLEEFSKKWTLDYDIKAEYLLMKKYRIKRDTARVYLNNLYYLSDSILNDKMNYLKEIKKFLEDNGAIIYDKYFRETIKNKKIYIYGYDYINKYYQRILKDFDYEIIEREKIEYQIDKIYVFDSIEDEVLFVVNKICALIKNGIDKKNIKIIASKEYEEVVDRIFRMHNLTSNIKRESIYSAAITKKILDNLDAPESYIDEIKDSLLKEQIIKILNNYSFLLDLREGRELIEDDFKNAYLKNDSFDIKISADDDVIADSDYVFFLGFNKENVPTVYKDNGYFSDKEKSILGLDTSTLLNRVEREKIIRNLKRIKNLTITCKLYDNDNNYTVSDLFGEEILIREKNNDFGNSNMMNKVLLTQKLDNLVKYNIYEDDLDLLYANYDIPYLKYDNSYQKISKDKLYKYLNNNLLLSYTHFDNYNRCKFRYYVANILKINDIKDDFVLIVGNVCHYVLSSIDNPDFELHKYFEDYLSKERSFSAREKFFLRKLEEEMEFVINTIKKQLTYTSFDKKMYEKKVYVNFDKTIKVSFMGVIDKVLYKEEEGYTYLVVIDYKTGNTDIKLENKEYGIGLQLPIYLYLSSHMQIKNVFPVGFYLQKILNNRLDNTKSFEEARENNLKLEGYSVNNEHVLSKFDKTYNDSKLIKSMKTTKNGFYVYSKVLSEEEIKSLEEEVGSLIDKAINEILEADFTIDPKVINGTNVSCNLCGYRDICYRKEKDIKYINAEVKDE